MNRNEILNENNFRLDGRLPLELRNFKINFHKNYVEFSHGLTSLRCSINGPKSSLKYNEKSNLIVNVSMNDWLNSFNVSNRKRSKFNKTLNDLSQSIKSTFNSVILFHNFQNSVIEINLHIINLDGSLLQTSINATTLALASSGIPLIDYVCACSAAVYNQSILLDLNNVEESDCPNATLAVLPNSNKIAYLSLETRLHLDRFHHLYNLTIEASKILRQEFSSIIYSDSQSLQSDLSRNSNINLINDT